MRKNKSSATITIHEETDERSKIFSDDFQAITERNYGTLELLGNEDDENLMIQSGKRSEILCLCIQSSPSGYIATPLTYRKHKGLIYDLKKRLFTSHSNKDKIAYLKNKENMIEIRFRSCFNQNMDATFNYVPSFTHDHFDISKPNSGRLNFHLMSDRIKLETRIYSGSLLSRKNSTYYDSNGDVFVKNFKLHIWKPISSNINGVPTSGVWFEISVLGNAYMLGTPAPRKEKLFDMNKLDDYTIINSNGTLMLWRTRVSERLFSMNENKGLNFEIVCPVTLEIIPTTSIANRIEVKKLPSRKKARNKLLFCRPWFFSNCG